MKEIFEKKIIFRQIISLVYLNKKSNLKLSKLKMLKFKCIFPSTMHGR